MARKQLETKLDGLQKALEAKQMQDVEQRPETLMKCARCSKNSVQKLQQRMQEMRDHYENQMERQRERNHCLQISYKRKMLEMQHQIDELRFYKYKKH